MTPAEFKRKWARYTGKETSAYVEHFNDLCRLLGQPTPVEADPSGNDFFCFQKRVIKDAELFNLEHPDSGDASERGFADVWKKDCFGWEYKGKKKNLDEAYKQLQRYREALRASTGPGRDPEALRRNLDQMNGVVAAAAGALKDWGEQAGGPPVQSPILAHPHFERLEAEGAKRGYASRLRKMLSAEPS